MDKNIENSLLMEYSSARVGKLQLTDCFGTSFTEHSQTFSSTHIHVYQGCFPVKQQSSCNRTLYGPDGQRHLVSGPFQESFADPCSVRLNIYMCIYSSNTC